MTTVLDPARPPGPTVTPRVRTAWRVAASVAAVLLLAFGVTQTISVLAHGERHLSPTFAAAAIEVVEIEVESGSVEVVAADVDEITVSTTVSDGFRPTGVDHEVVGERLLLSGTCPLYLSTFCAVHFDVRVPADVAVVARVDDGPVRVIGVAGAVEVDADNSGVELVSRAARRPSAAPMAPSPARTCRVPRSTRSTQNGSVDLGFTAAPETVLATSENGSVEVRLPEVVGDYRVEAGTDNGSTQIEVATDPASSRSVVLRSDDGDLRVLPSGSVDR